MALNNKTYDPVQVITKTAAEDLPAFRFVSHLGSLCASDTKAIGVTETNWLANEKAALVTLGTIAVESSTVINMGDNITADSSGKAKPAGNDSKINGRALESAVSGGFTKILLVP
ncbi:MAG: DUF2190 family protein [Candidatus Kapabacteria bacterium]|nr:DUF2190 family protein [Candidatus Kapabacteria bacterium]